MLILRAQLARLRDEERGFALILALGVVVVLSIATATALDYTTSNGRSASLSDRSSTAYSVAEAGLNNAMSILNSNNAQGTSNAIISTSLTGSTACPDGTSACLSATYDTGTAYWTGTYNSTTQRWTVTSWGSMRNPTVSSGTVVRMINATIKVISDPSQPANAAAWNYVFATSSSDALTCDMDVLNSVTIDYSIYVAGNLCLEGTANVQKPVSGDTVDVHVQGRIGLKNTSSNFIGTSTTKVDYVRTGYGCMDGNNPLTHTPPHACTGATDNVWMNNYDTNPLALSSPISTSYWTQYYASAQPGPGYACTSSTGTPPVWDNDTTLNLSGNGSAPTFNLTPASNYSCSYTDTAGKTTGSISWDATSKLLTVSGVMYCDCSMTISNGAANAYNGYATIYLTGTFTMSNGGTRLCGVISGTNCDFSGTFGSGTQSEMLVIAANGNDGSGNSIALSNGAQFQGGLIGIHNVNIGNSSQTQGGVIAPSVILGNSAIIKPMPTLTNLPLGAPGNNNTHASPEAPIVTSG